MNDIAAGTAPLPASALGLAVALGVGLLVGIERERRKGQGADRRAAGLRSFAVVTVSGALAQGLGVPGLVAVGALLVALLAALAYRRSHAPDPGMTTELALFASYLIGVQSMQTPALGAACGAGLAALLVARSRLHRFATESLSEQELQDGLLLAALALILLPLLPSRPLEWLGGINPRPMALLVWLIMAMQAIGQLALRRLGARSGLLLAGFVAGFVSSTAAIASLGSRVREQPQQRATLAGAAAAAATATWLQVLLLSAALAPDAALALLPMVLAGALGTGLCGLAWAWHAPDGPAGAPLPAPHSALRPREAILVGLTLAGVALLVSNAQQHLGNAAAGIGLALAGLADAHAPVASLAALHAAGRVSMTQMAGGVVLAIGANTLTRCVAAAVAGGAGYALRIATALLAGLALAGATAWLTVPH